MMNRDQLNATASFGCGRGPLRRKYQPRADASSTTPSVAVTKEDAERNVEPTNIACATSRNAIVRVASGAILVFVMQVQDSGRGDATLRCNTAMHRTIPFKVQFKQVVFVRERFVFDVLVVVCFLVFHEYRFA